MAKKAMTAASLIICLLLIWQPVLAADASRATEAMDAPDFRLDSPAEEGPPFEEMSRQPPTPDPAPNQLPDLGTPGQRPTWEQPLFEQRLEQESWQRQMPDGDDRGDGITREGERQRLQTPPPGVQPRRNGAGGQERPRRQLGPRRFAPTPDLNGRGSPFGFDPLPEDRPDQKP
jgi:hypothetical protein